MDTPALGDLANSYLSVVTGILGLEQQAAVDKAIRDLYNEADALAVMTVKSVSAFLWWAGHIASAAADVNGYGGQIETALRKAGKFQTDAWNLFLTVKYPADLQSLYDTLHGEVSDTGKKLTAAQAKGLGKLEGEIAALLHWKKVTVTPQLTLWRRFYASWRTTYLPPITTLQTWLASPAKFAQWSILPIMAAMVTTLKDRSHATLAASIESALTATWTSDPQAVLDNVLAWAVSG